jgi:hypothetical protein
MGKGNFFGLIIIMNKEIILFSIMKDNGGVVCLMVRVNIKNPMVICYFKVGDLYVGCFKNGLKHGMG